MTRRIALFAATAVYLALVAWVTLGSMAWHRGWESDYGVLTLSTWLDPDTWAIGSRTEFAANVVMFVPVGFLFALLGGPRRWAGSLAAAVALSLIIEIAQLPMDDRISDPRDLVANSAGAVIGLAIAAIGWLVGAVTRRLVGERRPTAETPRARAEASGPEPAPVTRQRELSRTGR